MTINLTVPQTMQELRPRITVVGVGGAGCNAVKQTFGQDKIIPACRKIALAKGKAGCHFRQNRTFDSFQSFGIIGWNRQHLCDIAGNVLTAHSDRADMAKLILAIEGKRGGSAAKIYD